MATLNRAKANPKRFDRSQIKFYIILAPIILFMLLPIMYLFSTAFKPIDELYLFPPKFLVQNPTLENFYRLGQSSQTGIPISRYIFNSLVATGVVLFLSIIISSMAGYALSKLHFKGKKALFEINQLALMFVAASIAIPKYLVIEKLGLIDTVWAHILPIMAIPVGLFLVKQFIDQIPDSLIEAARMDGATEFTVFRKIVLPIIVPALATIGILAFQTVWNNTDTSQFYTDQESMRTLAFYMRSFQAGTGGSVAGQGVTAAAALIMFVPNMIVFIIMQSKIMNTVAHSGIK